MIELKGISKVYRTDEVETTALSNLDLTIDKGEFVAIMGSSGCGKSTLLNILGLLDTPSNGTYTLLGNSLSNTSEKQRVQLRKNHLGFIFQSFNLIDELSVFENVELPLQYLNFSASERKEKVNRILKQIGMDHRAKHFPSQLSGGQQQRVAVARAVVTEPEVILADEPTGNLDSKHGRQVMEMITGLHETGTTVIMVTHNKSDAQYAQRVIQLFDGQVIQEVSNVPTL